MKDRRRRGGNRRHDPRPFGLRLAAGALLASPALTLARDTLAAGKPFVTANKAMIAHHGLELAALAEQRGVALKYEAAVAGGIPVIKGLREGAAANVISEVFGILNGTCNYGLVWRYISY